MIEKLLTWTLRIKTNKHISEGSVSPDYVDKHEVYSDVFVDTGQYVEKKT